MSRYTLKQAAAALHVSKRTIERAVKGGDLPGRKEAVGGTQVWTVDAADLAAWAQATNRRMDVGQATACPPRDATGEEPRGSDNPGLTGDNPTAGAAEDTQEPPRGATGGVGQPAADHDRLQARIRELEQERDFLRTMLDQALRALPSGDASRPPQDPPQARRAWWRRWFREGPG